MYIEKKGRAVHFETVLRRVRTEAAAHHRQRELCRALVSVHADTATGGCRHAHSTLANTGRPAGQGYQIDTRRKARVGEQSIAALYILYLYGWSIARSRMSALSLYALVDTPGRPLHSSFNTEQIHRICRVNLAVI